MKIVCIPAFNAEKSIGEVVKRCKLYADQVIVCDDGSSDKTASVAKASGAEVIALGKNLGKGAAMRTLFRLAEEKNPDILVTIDADGQFLPEEIPKLILPIIENKSDVVTGFRFDTETDMPAYRKYGNKLLDKVTSLGSNLQFRDTQCGFRAYSKRSLKFIHFTDDGFGADAEILINLSSKGLRITEEKVTVIYNTGGKTSTSNPVTHGASVFFNMLKYVSVRRPLTFFGAPGIVLVIVGCYYGYSFLHAYLHAGKIFLAPLGAGVLFFAVGIILCITSVILFSVSTMMKNR